MRKWLTLGGALVLCAWLPFLYAELTSTPKQQKARALPDDATRDDTASVIGTETAANEGAHKAEPEPAAQAKVAPEQAAKEAVVAKPAQAPDPRTITAKLEMKPDEAAADEAEATEPEGEAQSDPPAPPPTESGPTKELKSAFETQARDPLWAADTEKHIRALFRGELPAELLQTASCRSAVCLVELRWTRERAPAYVGFYESVRRDFAAALGVEPIGALDDKGQQQVNLYLARKGYTVADLTK